MSQQWYYVKDGQRRGPISTHELRDVVASGQLQADDLVWKEGMVNWAAARNLKGLFPARSCTNLSLPPDLPVRITSPLPSSEASETSTPPRVECMEAKIAPMRVALPRAPGVANSAPWFYALNGKRIGPVNDAGITHLLAPGHYQQRLLGMERGIRQLDTHSSDIVKEDRHRTTAANGFRRKQQRRLDDCVCSDYWKASSICYRRNHALETGLLLVHHCGSERRALRYR